MKLVVMAAGHGSRFGGPKQVTEVGPSNEFLMDYSIKYASEVGIKEIIIVSNDSIIPVISDHFNTIRVDCSIYFANQNKFSIKYKRDIEHALYGTGIALLAASEFLSEPFIILNGDDYYGREAFISMKSAFIENPNIVGFLPGYPILQTLSPNGTVSRAICTSKSNGLLSDITEHSNVGLKNDKVFSNNSIMEIKGDELVSMNFWGLQPDFILFVKRQFKLYLNNSLQWENKEFNIPDLVKHYLNEVPDSFMILPLKTSKWAGLTYPEDLPAVKLFLISESQNG